MYKDLIKIPTKDMSREEWLEERRKSIGGSDVATILGMNEWCSPYTLWCDKRGLLPEKEDNEAMRQGRDLEEYVAKRFCELTGKKVRRENFIIRNPKFPYIHANVDRVVVGEDAVLECKTVSSIDLKKFKNGEYPDRFYAQVCSYMLVCGFQKAYIAVVVLGRGFYVFDVERDEEELEALRMQCEDFWNLVETNTPPSVDGSESTEESLQTIYPESNGDSIDLFGFEEKLNEISALDGEIKSLQALQNEKKNEIKEYMEEAEKGTVGKYKVSYKTQDGRTTFNYKQLMLDRPDMDFSGYIKVGQPIRVFKITEKKEK